MPAPKTLLTQDMVDKMVEQGILPAAMAASMDPMEKQAERAEAREIEKRAQAVRDAILAGYAGDLELIVTEFTDTPIIASAKSDWRGWVATYAMPGYSVKITVTKK